MDHKHVITITIQSGRGSNTFTFPNETKVKDAARQAAEALGYPSNGSYSLVRVKDGQELDGERPLVSYHIQSGEILTLTEIGSGV